MDYPKDISGIYLFDRVDLTLTPVLLTHEGHEYFKLKEIWFEHGNARIIFDNAYVENLEYHYADKRNSNFFFYRSLLHVFRINASLCGVDTIVKIDLVINTVSIRKSYNKLL